MQPETATRQELDDAYFGEGLSPRNEDEFLVLTWKERTVFRFDRTSLELNSEEFTLPQEINEGWGITADESQKSASGNYLLYVSDGSDRIFEVDGDDFTILKTITVRNEDGTSQDDINELEFVDGSIYANVWYQDVILKIEPSSGIIEQRWDISSLAAAERSFQREQLNSVRADCLNGIAYDKESKSFYLSGKNHYFIFEVTLF